MRTKKIIFFGRLPPPYTGENIISKKILSLLENNFDITTINTSGKIEKKGGFFRKVFYYSNQIVHFSICFIRLRRIVKKEKFNFLYFSGSSSLFGTITDCLMLFFSEKNIDYKICHIHRGNYKLNFTAKRLYSAGTYLVKHVDKFIFLSSNLSEELSDYIPKTQRDYLFNPIEKSVLLSDEEFNEKHSRIAGKSKFIITYLSNFILSKGYMDLVSALKLLPQQYKNKITVRFIGEWIGSNAEKSNFFAEIESKELASIVEYMGPVTDRKRIKTLLTESDIFCLPSYYPLEAQPVSIIEAMNAGNAIISTFHASIPEYVDNKKTGLLVEKRNVEQLTMAIQTLCDAEVLSEFSMNARKKFLEGFSDVVVEKKLNYIFHNKEFSNQFAYNQVQQIKN